MDFLGFIVGLLTLSAIIWAIIENVFFVLKVLINSNKYDEKVRKRTKVLFPISVLSSAALIFLCFLFSKVSSLVWFSLILILFFFGFLPYIIISFILVELMILVKCVFFCRGKSDEDLRKASKILIPISVLYFGVSVIIRIFYEKLFNYMFSLIN